MAEEFLKSCIGHCILAFFIGLIVGLIIFVISKIRNAFVKRDFKVQIKELKSQIGELHKIVVDSGVSYSSQLDKLKKENDTMKNTMTALNRKANANELKTLYLYDKAIHIMYSKVPGFSVMWETSLKDAQKEMEQVESGKKKLFEKIFHPSLFFVKSNSKIANQEEKPNID